MTADELREITHRRPFKPFRVQLTSGESLDIRRTLRTTVADDRVYFGVDEDPVSGVARRLRIVALDKIASVGLATPA